MFIKKLILILSVVLISCSNNEIVMKIKGDSMEPTLKNGQQVTVDTNYGSVKRGDIVTSDDFI